MNLGVCFVLALVFQLIPHLLIGVTGVTVGVYFAVAGVSFASFA